MVDRFSVLDALGIMDTAPEPEFDNIALVAKLLCETPVALISLVHKDRQWFKAKIGFDPHQTPLNQSVCVHALSEPDMLVIPDLRIDPRSRDNTLVTGEPYIRFYAGVPIRVDGVSIGSLCVIDTAARDGLTAAQATGLRALAEQVAGQIASRDRERVLLASAARENERLNGAVMRSAALARLVEMIGREEDMSAMLRKASEILASAVPSTRAGFGIVDPVKETVDMQPEWRAVGTQSVAGMHRFSDYGSFISDLKRGEVIIIPDVAEDPRTAESADALLGIDIRMLINVPVIQHGRFSLVGFVHCDRVVRLTDEDITFIRTVADRVQAAIEHRRVVQERDVMNRELIHRVKNTLAMVGAIARQTFRGSDPRVASFQKRLMAVSTANSLLTQENWEASTLHHVLARSAEMTGAEQRVLLDGPQVAVGSNAIVATTMLFHELLTNALKYGALSVPTGQVLIRWRIADQRVTLDWAEIGGPPVTAPDETGFGSKLISMGLAGSGGATVEYAAAGLSAHFETALSELRA